MFKPEVKRTNGLNIIIAGCGKVGISLTERLAKEGHDITVIDRDSEKVQMASGLFDVMGIVGTGASFSIQMEAGIENADLFIAVTDSDELNLLCCTVAKRVGNCAAIARVRNPDYSDEVSYLREKLGLTMIINPELEAAREISRVLRIPTALEVSTFAQGRIEIIKFGLPKENILTGLTVAAIKQQKLAENILICAVERNGEVHIPSGNFRLVVGDKVSFIASSKDAKKFLKNIGFATNRVHNTIISGGGKVSYYLAKQLISAGISVKIIESRRKRCEELSVLLPKAIIINGDGTDGELLKEDGLEYADSFVPLTGIDEENILLTLFAREVSSAKVITKLNRINFKNVVSHLDLGSVIYPKYITAEAIIAYVRAKKASMNSNIETLYHMFDSRVEAIEFVVKDEPGITNIPLMDLNLKDNLLVSCIYRKSGIIIPSGSDSIQARDSVIIVTTHSGFNDIHDILK